MAYIVTRNQRFYVVAYDGTAPLTGRERRRWHPAGTSRADAEAIAAMLDAASSPPVEPSVHAMTVGRFLIEQWMPRRRTQLRATTAHRYEWMIDSYIDPRIGDAQLRCPRVEHVDRLYHDLLTGGSRTGGEPASKTVYDVHVIMRSSLSDAARRHLVTSNVALAAHAPAPSHVRDATPSATGSVCTSRWWRDSWCSSCSSSSCPGTTATAPSMSSTAHSAT